MHSGWPKLRLWGYKWMKEALLRVYVTAKFPNKPNHNRNRSSFCPRSPEFPSQMEGNPPFPPFPRHHFGKEETWSSSLKSLISAFVLHFHPCRTIRLLFIVIQAAGYIWAESIRLTYHPAVVASKSKWTEKDGRNERAKKKPHPCYARVSPLNKFFFSFWRRSDQRLRVRHHRKFCFQTFAGRAVLSESSSALMLPDSGHFLD